jgi:short-subunit dehydrogenase
MNRVVIVTGASSGIGLEVCKIFLSKGDIVLGISRTKCELLKENSFVCDVTSEEQVSSTINAIISKYGKIDILINNAGMGISGPIETTSLEDAKKLFDVNFFGEFLMIKYVLPIMRQNKSGRIVNTSSVASVFSIPFQSFYSCSKASVDALTSALREEVRPYNIKVCSVLPGDTKTGFTKSREKQTSSSALCYGDRMNRSVKQMEKDEQNGMSSFYVARVIYKMATIKNPPLHKTTGLKYKIAVRLGKVLPSTFVNFILGKIYAK